MKIKTCSKCGIEKPIDEFYKHKLTKDGHAGDCKNCRNKYNKDNERHLKLKRKEWLSKNKNHLKQYNKTYKKENEDIIKQNRSIYLNTNKEEKLERRRELYIINIDIIKQNKSKHKKKNNERERIRRKEDLNFRLNGNLKARVRSALKLRNGKKAYRTIELIGCSISNLKKHLESLFIDGMTWDNYGEWHIDHKIPCASFDLTTPKEQKKCFHYSNLQPLWAIDNIKKGASTA